MNDLKHLKKERFSLSPRLTNSCLNWADAQLLKRKKCKKEILDNSDRNVIAASKYAELATYFYFKPKDSNVSPPSWNIKADRGIDLLPNIQVKTSVLNRYNSSYPTSWLIPKYQDYSNLLISLCLTDYNLTFSDVLLITNYNLLIPYLKPSISIPNKNAIYLEDVVEPFDLFP